MVTIIDPHIKREGGYHIHEVSSVDRVIFNWTSERAKERTPHASHWANHNRYRQANKQTKFEANVEPALSAGKRKLRLVLVKLFLIGWRSGASYVNQSRSVVKQNQANA